MKKLLCISIIILASCSAGNKYYSDGKKWIPEDFSTSKNILLVEHYPGKEKWNTELKEFLEKKYPGKYEIVSYDDIIALSGKYAESKKYPYAVIWQVNRGTTNTSVTSGGATTNFSSPRADWAGHFLDRASGKEYPETKKYNNYGKEGYIPFFNSVIKYSR